MKQELIKLLENLTKENDEVTEKDMPKQKGLTKEEIMNKVEKNLNDLQEKNIESCVIGLTDGDGVSSFVYGDLLSVTSLYAATMQSILKQVPVEFAEALFTTISKTAIESYLSEHPEERSKDDLEEISKLEELNKLLENLVKGDK